MKDTFIKKYMDRFIVKLPIFTNATKPFETMKIQGEYLTLTHCAYKLI